MRASPGLVLAGLLACGKPTEGDLVGSWRGPDGASIVLGRDGAFEARALSPAVFMSPDERGDAFGGSGTWHLRQRDPYWELALYFRRIEGRPVSVELVVLVSGNGRNASLFVWTGEEGGDRYDMQRQR